MVGYHQILCNKNHKIVNMVGWPTLVKYVIFMIFVQAYLNDAYHMSTPPGDENKSEGAQILSCGLLCFVNFEEMFLQLRSGLLQY